MRLHQIRGYMNYNIMIILETWREDYSRSIMHHIPLTIEYFAPDDLFQKHLAGRVA